MKKTEELKTFFKEKGIKQKELAEILDVSQPYVNALLNGSKEFGKKQAQTFYEKFGISPNWLLTGDGPLIAGNKEVSQLHTGSGIGKSTFASSNPAFLAGSVCISPLLSAGLDLSTPKEKTIRYWQDIDATCGGTEIFTDCDSAKIINLQIPDFKDCTDAINIYGDSMYPQYKNGQIILLKKWEESYIEYGCAYLIVTTGGHRMVKQLRKAPDESNVICYSVNQEFEQFEIPKKDILSLWLVKGSIDKSNI